MADKISRKSSMRTRNGSKDLPLTPSGIVDQEASATTSKLAAEESTTHNHQANKKLSKKRKSSSSLHKKDSNTSDLAKRSASTSKSTAINSSVSSTSSTDSTSYKSESTKKQKKKQRLNQTADTSFDNNPTKTNRDSSRSAKSKAIVNLSNSNPSNSKSQAVDFEEGSNITATASSSSNKRTSTSGASSSTRRRQSNDSSSHSSRILRGHRNDSNISLEALSNTVEETTDVVDITEDTATVEITEESNLELEEESKYQNRLRRPSSSSSKSTTKVSANNRESSLLEAVPTKRQKLSKSNLPTTSRSSDTPDQKRKTGSCISKPCDVSHLTSSSRRNQQSNLADSQPSSSAPLESPTTAASASAQEATYESKTKMSGKNSKAATNKSTAAATTGTAISTTTTTNTKSTDAEKSASTASAAAAKATCVRMVESGESSDNDTSAEFNRLSDILQSRGLPSHIVNAFGSKVQQFLHRTMSSGISSRSQNLISTLQQPDDSLKLTALAEICQLLVMGNEDTLVGFPIKQAVPLLLACMNSESENFDLMNHACRALTYMMESLPRSSGIIAEGIGIFLEKLQVIQCMDVAEQSLTALEILSRRHSKQILNATQSGSISACLTYIDFFSITAQRNALQITASCCQNMIKDEFVNIQSSLPILSQRLTHSDKKSVEYVCTIFARLVENFQKDSVILKEIASHDVLLNLQQLLVVQPSVVSPSMFVTILHTIYLMCANCTELATELLENNISNIFISLLVGNSANPNTDTSAQNNNNNKTTNDIEILSTRTTQELFEIVSIIGEIMPSLPKTGLFSIDETLRRTYVSNQNDNVSWQWKDEREVWRPYTPADSQIIESSYNHEENECILNTSARSYVLDFTSMMQINEETGTARPIARKHTTDNKKLSATSVNNSEAEEDEGDNNKAKAEINAGALEDSRLAYLKKNPKVYAEFVSSLFAILYGVYSSSAGPAIKHRCLRSLLRMIYYLPHDVEDNRTPGGETSKESNVLYSLLKNLPVSSQIASMLASVDTKILVSALQMCEILMQKMPDIFSVYFHREGVIHQIDKLIEASAISLAAATTLTSVVLPEEGAIATTSAKPTDSKKTTGEPNQTRKTRSSTSATTVTESTGGDSNSTESETQTTTIANHSKRKARPSHASKYTDSAAHTNSKQFFKKTLEPTTKTSNNETTSTDQSLTSNTAKYFRSFMTKMQGNNNSTASTSTTDQNTAVAVPASTTVTDTKPKTGEFMFSNDPLWAQFKSSSSRSSNPFAAFQVDSQLEKLTANQFIVMKNAGSVGSGSKSSTAKTIVASSSSDEQSQQQKNSIDYQQINVNKEKVRQWIFEQAKRFRETYFPMETASGQGKTSTGALNTAATGLDVLNRLKKVVGSLDVSQLVQLDEALSASSSLDKTQIFTRLNGINKSYLDSLAEISNIINETDISSFEMIHSGLIEKLVSFLSIRDLQLVNLDKKLSQHSINYSSFSALEHCNPSYVVDLNEVIKNEFKMLHCKQFFSIFSRLPFNYYCQDILQPNAKSADTNLFSSLLSKLHNCVNQLEQFAVRVNDVPSSADGSASSKNAIKFFNTHQLKCLLRRHPACGSSSAQPSGSTVLIQWKGGPVKVDPLASVSTIEKYLVCRGIHRVVPSSTSSSISNQGNIFNNQKSMSSRFSSKATTKSKSQAASGKSKLTTSKPSSSRLYILKAAAEMATDRFKLKKSRNSLKAHSKPGPTTEASTLAASKASKTDSTESKKLSKGKKAKKTKSQKLDKEAKSSSSKKSSKKTKSAKASGSSKCKPMEVSVNKSRDESETASYLVEEVDDDEDEDFQDFENDEEEYEMHDRIDEDLLEEDDDDEIDYEDEEDELIDEDDDMDGDDLDNEGLEEGEDYEDADGFDQDDIEDEIDESDDEDDEDDEFNEGEDDDDDDDDDEDDIESAMSAILGTIRGTTTSASSMPKIELLINNQVLPSNMSVYQAIKTYSAELNKDAENELENSFMNNAIWSKLHMIHYRLQHQQKPQPATTSSKTTATEAAAKEPESGQKRITRASHSSTSLTTTPSKTTTKALNNSKTLNTSELEHSLLNLSNTKMDITSTMFYNYLTNQWPTDYSLSLRDQSLESISLLRTLNALNRNWYMMYSEVYGQDYFVANSLASADTTQTPVFLVSPDQFVNAKLTAKANRQLQDPLVIMTGHLPKWLPELMQTCPFLFAFKTRLMHFYVTTLDRDRAMQKLIDLNANMAMPNSESDRQNDRFVPKLDKKKRTIARYNDIIKQTDTILNEFCVNSIPASSSSGANSSVSGSSSSHHSSKPPLLEIQYEGEVGTGLGPTLEFYALVSLEVQKCEFEMWRGDKIKLDSVTGQNQGQFFFFSPSGLFPAPLQVLGKQSSKQQAHIAKIKGKFKFLGKFLAKSVMDFRVIDIPLSYVFYKWLVAPNSLCEDDIKYIDASLFNSIESLRSYLRRRRQLLIRSYKLIEGNPSTNKLTKSEINEALKANGNELKELEETVEAIDLDFTLPGYGYDLKKGGKDISVTLENLEEYLKLIVDYTLSTGVEQQLESFKEGFESILSMSGLSQFYPEELERVFCGSGFHDWNLKALNECTRCDHGYTHESKAVKNLFEIMCSFDEQEQRQFLQFITGSPRLPVGGLQSLVPPLTIVRKTTDSSDPSNSADNSDDRYLPSVMTCVNYLKLPDYSSVEVMKDKLVKAMQMGQLSFHLS